LVQYQRFQDARKSTTTRPIAGQIQQLVELLASAPQHMWVELLEEILLLLESNSSSASDSVLPMALAAVGTDTTMQLMQFLTHKEGCDSPFSPELCMRLRLALSHSLANSFAI